MFFTNATANFSGKTTLSKAISTVASTAAFDKNPQSKERGITLDLGFSSFSTPSAEHMQKLYPQTQYTLVDCPGHGKKLEMSFVTEKIELQNMILNNVNSNLLSHAQHLLSKPSSGVRKLLTS